MLECQHAQCHNVQNCAICWKEGTTWCPHQKCRYQYAKQPPATTKQPQPTKTRGIAWTPTVAGNVLKFAFVAAAAAGTWWLLQSGGNATREEGDPLASDAKAGDSDFSSWEPRP